MSELEYCHRFSFNIFAPSSEALAWLDALCNTTIDANMTVFSHYIPPERPDTLRDSMIFDCARKRLRSSHSSYWSSTIKKRSGRY